MKELRDFLKEASKLIIRILLFVLPLVLLVALYRLLF